MLLFHHLYIVYDESNRMKLERLTQYMDADTPFKAKLLQKFYEFWKILKMKKIEKK